MNSPLSKPILGRLEKINVRNYWQREDIDFTPWLAELENIALLGDTIGIELEVEAREKEVGPFRADVLCKDTATEQWVLIENQLERTDHIHLGQLMTYAAGLNVVTIVWIAARFTEEHRAALDWLNEITNEGFNFFGLEIELWQIGTSAIAPKFNIVSSPNNWSKTVTGAAQSIQNEAQTGIKKLQVEYWQAFCEYAIENAKRIKTTKPLPQNWMNIAIGRSSFLLNAIASTWNSETETYEKDEIRAELQIAQKNAQEAKAYFNLLRREQSTIESEFGEPLIWDSQPNRKACRIVLRKTVDLEDQNTWTDQHQWLVEKLDKMHKVFSDRIKRLTLNDANLDDIEEESVVTE
jgi:hypothetical protein